MAGMPHTSEGGRRWSFGPAVLDERTLELQVNRELISVERKPLEVLLFLLHHAGEVVTKDEILEAVWPGRILSETVLTKCVQKLREALLDGQQEIIKTQHGYGYRLAAPVKVEASVTKLPPRFDFKVGDHPPGRSNWNLIERLGTGGHGEVWLARHHKTGEARVFKFALDGASLVALKREITLYRLLNDALGDKAAIVQIHDWNLEQPPYFIESEYVEEGSLTDWAERQGGLTQIPLATRLEVAAQIAEALAAAHSVGVLHKDLKPSNVLVVRRSELPTEELGGRLREESGQIPRVARDDTQPRIKLADFGSGGVLDPHRLEQMGITRLGFTKTVGPAGTTSGTPIYFAPEVIAGQPFTVQADIYAVGVMLYQLVVGDFHRSLAPGWEHDVQNELLREDIAAAAAGNLNMRLSDAGVFAQRLRNLAARRKQREAEAASRREAERLRLALERLRARRAWMAATVAVLVAGLGASLWLYRDAVKARDSALAVSAFLTRDVLSMADPFLAKPADMTVKAMLDRAAQLVDKRLAAQPEAAAQVHYAVGYAYGWLAEPTLRIAQMARAADVLEAAYGPDDLRTLLSRYWGLGTVVYARDPGRLIATIEGIKEQLTEKLGPAHPQVIEFRCNLAHARLNAKVVSLDGAIGEYRRAIGEGQAAVDRGDPAIRMLPEASWVLFLDPIANDPELLIEAKQIGFLLLLAQAGRFEEIVDEVNTILPKSTRKFGEHHFWPAKWRSHRGRALMRLGRMAEAETDLRIAVEDTRQHFGQDHRNTQLELSPYGVVLRSQGKLKEAARVHEQALAACRQTAPKRPDEATAHSCAKAEQDLAETLRAAGDLRRVQ